MNTKTRPRVLIGLPTMSSIHVYLAVRIMAWLSEAYTSQKYDLAVYPTLAVQPVDNARNSIVREFMRSDYTHLFFVDSDTIPPQDALEKLLAMDKEIATGITPIIEHDDDKNEWYRKPNIVGMDDKGLMPHTGIYQVKGCGSSCILIKREVFEKLEQPWYRFVYKDDKGKNVIISEDINFIINALSKGMKAYCDTSIICKHNKAVVW